MRGVVLHFDTAGRILGIEQLNASMHLPAATLPPAPVTANAPSSPLNVTLRHNAATDTLHVRLRCMYGSPKPAPSPATPRPSSPASCCNPMRPGSSPPSRSALQASCCCRRTGQSADDRRLGLGSGAGLHWLALLELTCG